MTALLVVTMFYANGVTDTIERYLPDMATCTSAANAVMRENDAGRATFDAVEVTCREVRKPLNWPLGE